jgi:hypothetical protein
MKIEKYTIRTVSKSNQKILETISQIMAMTTLYAIGNCIVNQLKRGIKTCYFCFMFLAVFTYLYLILG